MKIYIKLVTSLLVLFCSTQLFANTAAIGQVPDAPCCTECVDDGRSTAAAVVGSEAEGSGDTSGAVQID